jgi:hypothetical protein
MNGLPPVRRRAGRRAGGGASPAASLTQDLVSGHNPPGRRIGIRILVASKWVHKGYLWLLGPTTAEYGKAKAKTARARQDRAARATRHDARRAR